MKCVGNNPNDDAINAPYFQDLVLQELKKIPEISGKMAGGLKVYTTLNTELYTAIMIAFKKEHQKAILKQLSMQWNHQLERF